jgi:hypothetical protein
MNPDDVPAELLRQEADRYQPSDALAAVGRRIRVRRRRRRERWAGLSIAAAALIVTAVIVATRGGTPTPQRVTIKTGTPAVTHLAPLAAPGLTPKGWAPIQLGAIQVSVPSPWLIEDLGDGWGACGGGVTGEVFIRRFHTLPAGPGCKRVVNTVTLKASSDQPLERSRRQVINGVAVTRGFTGSATNRSVVERALGMEVMARGPLAGRVLRTLTHSPLSVVLNSKVNSVPKGWRPVSFGGLRFDVPASWTLTHEPAQNCPSDPERDNLMLQTADAQGSPSCQPTVPSAGNVAARPGLIVASGRLLPPAPKDAACRQQGGLRICVDPAAYALGLLTAQVGLPGQAHPDQIELGLSGTGLQALEIFDSIRPA